MKILMEDVLAQFEEKKGINSYLEGRKSDQPPYRDEFEPFDPDNEFPEDKPAPKKSKPKKAPKTGQAKKSVDEDEFEEEPEEDLQMLVMQLYEEIDDLIYGLFPQKKIKTEATKAFKAFCKSHKISEDEAINMIHSHIDDGDKEDMRVTDLFFLSAI